MNAQKRELQRCRCSRPMRTPFLAVIAAGLLWVGTAGAAEIIPSVGMTRSVDSDATKSLIGLAFRGAMIPHVLDTEIAAGYRDETYAGGALEVKQVPVTASLLLTPIPSLYGGAGVGWYNTKYDYRDPLLQDETKQKFGVHVEGGVKVPLAPSVALDLGGRYAFLEKQENLAIPQKFNPDFWTLSLGMAFRF